MLKATRRAGVMRSRTGITDTLLGATVHGGKVERLADVLITGDVPEFFPVHAGSHQAPAVAGP